MTDEMIQEKAEELFGKEDKMFPISEFAKERDIKCFKQGAQWAKQQMIEKACKWLNDNVKVNGAFYCFAFKNEDIEAFKKAMEE